MSKLNPVFAPPSLAPQEQIAYYVKRAASRVHPASLEKIQTRVRELNLDFDSDEIFILAALDNPRRVQWFLDNEVYYNNDHAFDDQEETSLPPRMVLRTGMAHCFEGALFAYTVNYLHGFEPRWMLLEGTRDVDHNLVVYQDKHAVRWGCNAHSGYPHLGGREPEFFTLREIAETYYPHYYSGYTNDPRDLTIMGFSDPVDLTEKFGVQWMASLEPLWDIYYLLVDDTWTFHQMTPPYGAQYRRAQETHLYTPIAALKNGWITVQTSSVSGANASPETAASTALGVARVQVNVNRLPPDAQTVWHEFWKTFDPDGLLPRGRAAELEGEFYQLTGTTPIDLNFNAEEIEAFLERGYKLEQLIH
jgi:hypothetical protein